MLASPLQEALMRLEMPTAVALVVACTLGAAPVFAQAPPAGVVMSPEYEFMVTFPGAAPQSTVDTSQGVAVTRWAYGTGPFAYIVEVTPLPSGLGSEKETIQRMYDALKGNLKTLIRDEAISVSGVPGRLVVGATEKGVFGGRYVGHKGRLYAAYGAVVLGKDMPLETAKVRISEILRFAETFSFITTLGPGK
jgi:hypothetical protein